MLDYLQLERGAFEVAHGLIARGHQRGQSVAIMLPTGPDYLCVFMGILVAGGVPVPLYPPARAGRLQAHLSRQNGIIESARCAHIVTTAQVRRLGYLLPTSFLRSIEAITPEELRKPTADRSGSLRAPATATACSQDVALLQYTSGSTGDPKGVILSHANLLANVRAIGKVLGASPADVMVSWLPLYHDMGLIGAWLGSLYHGCTLVLMSPTRFLERPSRWLRAIHDFGGTLSAAPNFAYELCASKIPDDELRDLDLSSWRVAMSGAEPVSPSTVRRFCSRFAGRGFRTEAMTPVYGLAECALGVAFRPPGGAPRFDRIDRGELERRGRAVPAGAADDRALEFTSCGTPLPGYQLRIVDDEGRPVRERQQGRLQIRGPSLTRGYFGNPKASAQLFDRDWLQSGDLAYVAGGELFVTGRSKDLVIQRGRKVHAHELEEAVGQIAGVRAGCVAVFGSYDVSAGTELLVVVAETRLRGLDARRQLCARIAHRVAEHSGVPADRVLLIAPHTLPKTSSGKLRRAACRDLFERGGLDPRAPERVGQHVREAWSRLWSALGRAAPQG